MNGTRQGTLNLDKAAERDDQAAAMVEPAPKKKPAWAGMADWPADVRKAADAAMQALEQTEPAVVEPGGSGGSGSARCCSGPDLGLPFGLPVVLGIVQMGVAMHAAAAIYTKLAAAEHLGAVLRRTRAPPERGLSCLLPAGLQAMVAERVEPLPLVPVHVPGQRLEALPAGLAAPPFRRRSSGLPCVKWEDIMGHSAGVADGLPTGGAVVALRDAVALPTLVSVMASALALQRHYIAPHDMQTLPEQLQRPPLPLGGGADDDDESLIACALLQRHPGSALAIALTTGLAGVAEDQEDADKPLCGDVWRDVPVLEALSAGCGVPGGDVAARRVARRAAHYRWEGVQLLRAMPGGRSRVCPPPDARWRLVEAMHGRLGHLGVRRTLALLRLGHWWYGMRQDVLTEALRKACYEAADPAAREKGLPELLLGYRCSPQASTRYSPYQLLYGGIVPPLDFEDTAAAAEPLLQRSAWVRQAYPAAAGNLLIAQHRDTLRYSAVRTGRYLAKPVVHAPGDYVYVRRGNVTNTLQFPQHDTILRMESRRSSVEQLLPCHLPVNPIVAPRLFRPARDLQCEVCGYPHDEARMLLCDGCNTGWHWRCRQLSARPLGMWLCPGCSVLPREGMEGPPEPGQLDGVLAPPPQPPDVGRALFPRASTRRLDEEAAGLHPAEGAVDGAGAGQGSRAGARWGFVRARRMLV
ncbi:PHD and RING finger domain-containing protein 1 [Tetrabaena socialis]|uniref:PHD and RING finger domain-containing protein 1 n=1 Tax=Tetrabaena socialis TaxID=47790 RepID=A0A2J8A6R4_9CHLO|nr:PHD and RING finger domain-containing protein 1 [Tetrabaena socialis]|eukprot:PNH08221.1 PHD and RING finger domain-containing protein 1 [Tetrabaena socialis]